MTSDRKFPGMRKIMERVFESMDARPEHIFVPNVLISNGDSIGPVYVCPQRPGELYMSEEAARRELRDKETLYEVGKIRRVE